MSQGRILPLLSVIGLTALGAAAGYNHCCKCYEELKIYNQARQIAIQNTGDRQSPLTKKEKREWYFSMGVREGRPPTREQLELFINEHKK